MKKLSKIISILLFFALSFNLQAENIDECKNDLYFANGIMMKYSEEKALRIWKKEAEKLLLSKPKVYAKIANVKMSYNISQGFLDDLLESFEQVMSNEWGWRDFTLFFSAYLTEKGIQEDWVPHIKDLVRQTNSYKESIKLGHNVIVVAHSQGNYYTNEAYDLLDAWMKPYFHMMGVATPANHVAGDGPYVTFHNDMIKSIVAGLPTNRDNPNPNHNGTFSIEAHDFYTSYMTASNTRAEIQNFILNQVTEHEKAPSQWETDQEFGLNTCNYKITVKHRYDPSIEMGEKVYPFAPNKKLYQVKGEWVKASCGGKNILGLNHDITTWHGKKDNECLMIDNPEKEKINRGSITYFVNLKGNVMAGAMVGEIDQGHEGASASINLKTFYNYFKNGLAINDCDAAASYTSIAFPNTDNIWNKHMLKYKNALIENNDIKLIHFDIKQTFHLQEYAKCYNGTSTGPDESKGYSVYIEIETNNNYEDLYYNPELIKLVDLVNWKRK